MDEIYQQFSERLQEEEKIYVGKSHSGMNTVIRAANQRFFLHDNGIVFISTTSFGFGFSIPKLTNIIHVGSPTSTVVFYNNISRSTQDMVSCTVFWNRDDFSKHYIDFSLPHVKHMRNMVNVPSSVCRNRQLSEYNQFSLPYDRCNICDNCIKFAEYGEIIPSIDISNIGAQLIKEFMDSISNISFSYTDLQNFLLCCFGTLVFKKDVEKNALKGRIKVMKCLIDRKVEYSDKYILDGILPSLVYSDIIKEINGYYSAIDVGEVQYLSRS